MTTKCRVMGVVSGFAGWLVAGSAWAVCPVCTVAVGAGVGLLQYWGVDDTVAGVWVGALTVSVTLWTNNWLEKKNIRFRLRDVIVATAYLLLVIWPLHRGGFIGHPFNTLWGVDKLILGFVVGGAVFYGAARWYDALKAKNGGHSYFPFQKVVMPVVAVAIASVVFYLITRSV